MKPLSLVLAAAALLSTAALAQQTEGAQSSAFKALDADGNGSISTQEAQASPIVARSFATADQNKDGSLSRDEFDASFTTAPPSGQAPPGQTPPESSPPPASPPPPK